MGMNPFLFLNGTPNHDTHPIPWTSNHFSLGMSDMSSHFPSVVSSSYVNPSFGYGGMMPPYYPFLFGGSHIPQPTLTVGGWNLPSYGSNPSFTFPRESDEMTSHSTYYISPIYPSSSMSVPTNTFPMAYLHLSFGVSSGGVSFIVWKNPFMNFLHPGETYILT
jgi:hypothetical protein